MPSPVADKSDTPDLVLVNPISGSGKGQRAAIALRRYADESGWTAEIRSAESADALGERARRGAAEGRPRIFTVGGDGTFQIVVNAIGPYTGTALGLLPAGGGNDLAAALDLPGDAVAAAKLLRNGRAGQLDAVRVRTANGRERLYTAGGGVGLDAEASRHAAARYRSASGRARYIFSALHALRSFQAMEVRVQMQRADGATESLSSRALVVAVLNAPSYGAGVRIAPEARVSDGELDFVLLEELKVWEIAALLPLLAAKGEVRTKRLERRRIHRVRIETNRPSAFHGDGEILGVTPVEIEIVPNAFRILRP